MKHVLSIIVAAFLIMGWSLCLCAGPLDTVSGASSYGTQCRGCHGSGGEGGGGPPSLIGCGDCTSIKQLFDSIETTMPKGNPSACIGTCSENVAAYVFEAFNGNERHAAYIPHITSGFDDWTDYLQIDNNGASETDVHLALYGAGEMIYSGFTAVAGRSETTPPMDLKALGSAAETGVVTWYGPGLNFRVTTVNSGGGIAEFPLAGERAANLGFYFTDFEGTPLSGTIVNKGLALANMTDTGVDVVLYAVGGGQIVGTSQPVSLGAYQRIFGTHVTWFPGAGFDDVKKIIAVTSSASLAGIVISSDRNVSRLLFTPGFSADSFPD